MTTADLLRLQSAVAEGRYDLTQHAVEELADDDLDILDLESAVAAAILLTYVLPKRSSNRVVVTDSCRPRSSGRA